MKYINADKLKAEIERYENTAIDAYNPLGEDADLWHGKVVACEDLKTLITSLQQEQPEVQNGKFVFPKYLYARTKDNKTIDMSYAPQDMTAIEYIRNDFVEQEQPEVELEKEWKSYMESRKDDLSGSAVTVNMKDLACHFHKLGQSNQYQKDREEFARLKMKEWQEGYDEGYAKGLNARKEELPEIELNKFTEKIKTFHGRYKPPKSFSIKGAMAFMARMFYQYPNVARKWYDSLPKATMDNERKE